MTRTKFVEQRVEPREIVALPLKLEDGRLAIIRNISASGIYLEISGMCQFNGTAEFAMEINELKFTAQAEVVRLDVQLGKTGIAFRLVSPKLDATPNTFFTWKHRISRRPDDESQS